MWRKKLKKWFKDNGELLFVIVVILIVLGSVSTSMVACVKYGNKPISEIPAWALLFMFGNKK